MQQAYSKLTSSFMKVLYSGQQVELQRVLHNDEQETRLLGPQLQAGLLPVGGGGVLLADVHRPPAGGDGCQWLVGSQENHLVTSATPLLSVLVRLFTQSPSLVCSWSTWVGLAIMRLI